MKLVFTEQFYYPEGWGGAEIPRDLTSYLACAGAKVEVICGGDQYVSVSDDEHVSDPRLSGVVIRRIPRVLGGTIHQRKLLKQIIFYVGCCPLLCFRRSPSMFITQTNPPLIVCFVALAALIHRRPFVIIAQDIYPEVAFAHAIGRRNVLGWRLVAAMIRWAYRRATRVVALGNVMTDKLITKGVEPRRITVISNWATGDALVDRSSTNTLRRTWNLVGQFVVLYSGNLGLAHDVETPIAALRLILEKYSNVRLVFIGVGSRLLDARRVAADAGVLHAVQFHPFVATRELPQSMGLADVALVTLRDGFEGIVVPSKLSGYMARGIPTIYVGPHSDVEDILVESGGGLCFRNGDAGGMFGGVRSLVDDPIYRGTMGVAAARHYDSRLSRSLGLKKYVGLIDVASTGV